MPQPRATEILERLAAGFREMDCYGVKFGVVSGDYEARGSYVVEGEAITSGWARGFRRRSRRRGSTTAAAR